MKYCPNPECSFYLENDFVSEFEDYVETCVDCGATLVHEQPVFDPEVDEMSFEALPDSEMVILQSLLHPTEAHILRGRLMAEGIPAFVANERSSSFYLPTPGGGVYLLVQSGDVERAAEILGLDAGESEDEESDADESANEKSANEKSANEKSDDAE